MAESFISETELPGRPIDADTLRIIAHRYHWAAQFITGKRVLEVCCGPGLGFGWLARHTGQVVGGDITHASLTHAHEHYGPRGRFACLDAHTMPFADQSQDVVICVAAIIYLEMPAFLAECRRVLKSGGILLLNTPNKELPSFRPSTLSRHYYSVPELSAMLRAQKFQARFFGAFPATTAAAASKSSLPTIARRWSSAALRFLHLEETVRKLLGRPSPPRTLTAELAEAEMRWVADISLAEIPDDSVDRRHRIVYVVAETSAPTLSS